MKVRETQLPGVGIRYNIQFDADGEFVIVVYNNGDRETFWKPPEDADSNKLFEVSASEAQKIANIFDGTYFEPVDQDLDDVFHESLIRWIHISDESPVAGRTIAESQIRSKTGISVLAVQRGERTISNPDREETIHPDDVLVTVGNDEQYDALIELLD